MGHKVSRLLERAWETTTQCVSKFQTTTFAEMESCRWGRRPLDADESDEYWLSTSSYTQPSRLSLALATDGAAGVASCDPIKALPPLFDAEGIEAFQEFATSKDGTRVPSFRVQPQ